jgi:hypothetical protein
MVTKNTWKAIAIIFILLCVMETTLIAWALLGVLEDDNNEKLCLIDICGYNTFENSWNGNNDGYHFDEEYNMCYCYEGDNLTHQEVIE